MLEFGKFLSWEPSIVAGLSTFWVLVLNQTFEPLHVCPARRAVTMLLRGRAEKVEEDGYIVRSPSMAFRLPSVIRLRRYISPAPLGRDRLQQKECLQAGPLRLPIIAGSR